MCNKDFGGTGGVHAWGHYTCKMGSNGDNDDHSPNRTSNAPDIASDSEQGRMKRQPSETSSCHGTDLDEEESAHLQLGPKWSIKQHLEKDKDDESLRRWKEQLIGSVDSIDVPVEDEEPDVKIMSLTILSPGRPDILLDIPENGNPKGPWFTLKEGSRYSLRFSIRVSKDIVCGLRYTNTVWKTGIKVDSTKEMFGTFGPQAEPYTHEIHEETTPSGYFARGSYTAKSKFVDDDNRCYLEINYTFEIQKDWPSN